MSNPLYSYEVEVKVKFIVLSTEEGLTTDEKIKDKIEKTINKIGPDLLEYQTTAIKEIIPTREELRGMGWSEEEINEELGEDK